MKIKLVLLLFFSILLSSCKEEKQIEIVPNLEAEYLSEAEVDTPIEFNSEQNDSASDEGKDLIEAIKSIHDFNSKDSIRYIVKLRLYCNERGNLEKVRDISNLYDRSEYCTDGVKNYADRDKLNKALAQKLEKIKFKPAIKNGKNVKSWFDLKGVSILTAQGDKFQLELTDFLVGMFGSKSNYLISTDEMPEIIGGLYAIQKNIKYPELAKRAGIEGKVYVLAYIDETGKVADAKVIKGIGAGCNEAAVAAVKAVSFTPGRKNGEPVKVQVTIPILFKLQ